MDIQRISEYLGLRDTKAFSMLIIAGFSAILVGAVFLIISILVVNDIGSVVGPQLVAGPYNNYSTTLNTTYVNVITSISQALTIAGVALIVVGVAIIAAVLFGNCIAGIITFLQCDQNGGRWRSWGCPLVSSNKGAGGIIYTPTSNDMQCGY